MKKNKLIKHIRWGLLLIFTILISISAYLHITQGASKAPSIHGLCPFGGLESLYQVFTTGSFVSKIFAGTMILFIITLVLAILFRRSFCGLICPFGAIQELFAKIGYKIFKKKFVIPAKIDRPMRYLKYVILIVTVFYAWKTAGLWMSPYDPWSAYAHLPEGLESVWKESAVGLIILIITLLGSLLYDRFFCKYLCPMGALYAIIGKLSPFKVVRNEKTCIDCGKCTRVCPMNIDVQKAVEVKSAECINCQLCTLSCPKAGAIESKEAKKALKPLTVIVLVMVVFFGSIFAFQAAGLYKLSPDKLKAGETISYEEIKGYMTIEDAAKATNTELKEFYEIFEIPESVPPETMMKEIKEFVPGYEIDDYKNNVDKAAETEAVVKETEVVAGIESESAFVSESEVIAVKETEAAAENESETAAETEAVAENESGTAAETEAADIKIDVDKIKGSLTIKAAAEVAAVELKEFYKLFKIPESVPSNTYMKDIGNFVENYEFGKIKESLRD